MGKQYEGGTGTIGEWKPWCVRFITLPVFGSSWTSTPYGFDSHHAALRFAQRSLAGDGGRINRRVRITQRTSVTDLSEFQQVRATVLETIIKHEAQAGTRPVRCACGWVYSDRPSHREAISHVADVITNELADLVGLRQG